MLQSTMALNITNTAKRFALRTETKKKRNEDAKEERAEEDDSSAEEKKSEENEPNIEWVARGKRQIDKVIERAKSLRGLQLVSSNACGKRNERTNE